MYSISDRKIALTSFQNWLLRICFAGCVFKILYNDYESILSQRAMFDCGLSK